ncbi:MAG: GDSL-type esterase/lipase family protein [Chloroflexota bacterium]
MKRAILVLGLIVLLLAPTPVRAQQPAVRILPLGDSTTRGLQAGLPVETSAGYRLPLIQLLAADGAFVDLVGSQSNGPSSMADRDHEGHNGWRTTNVQADIASILTISQPDIVLLAIGINDLTNSAGGDVSLPPPADAAAQTAARFGEILNAIEQQRPSAWTLVQPITPLVGGPLHPDYGVQASEYNQRIWAEVSSRAAQGRRVRWAPVAWSTALVNDGGVHPNAAGYQVMAQSWYQGLKALPPSALSPCFPRPVVTIQRTGSTVTVAAATAISSIQIGATVNATVTPPVATGNTAAFTAGPTVPGPWTVPFTVIDACGPWQTFVGGGS